METNEKQILIAGATGLIGKELTQSLVNLGYRVMVLTRNPDKAKNLLPKSIGYVEWNGTFTSWLVREVEKSFAIINLTGEGIAEKRWTKRRRIQLVRSRLGTTRALAKACTFAATKPMVFIQASAIGYYPNSHNNEEFTEDSPQGSTFVSRLTFDWESVALHEIPSQIRLVMLRTGLVLSKSGGILPKLLLPIKLYFGGWIGNGKQLVSWIHIHDQVNAILFLLDFKNAKGPFNLVAPNVVTMKDLVKCFAKAMHMPVWTFVPEFAVRLFLGEMGETIILSSQRVVPQKLLDLGFQFSYPTLNEAVGELVKKEIRSL